MPSWIRASKDTPEATAGSLEAHASRANREVQNDTRDPDYAFFAIGYEEKHPGAPISVRTDAYEKRPVQRGHQELTILSMISRAANTSAPEAVTFDLSGLADRPSEVSSTTEAAHEVATILNRIEITSAAGGQIAGEVLDRVHTLLEQLAPGYTPQQVGGQEAPQEHASQIAFFLQRFSAVAPSDPQAGVAGAREQLGALCDALDIPHPNGENEDSDTFLRSLRPPAPDAAAGPAALDHGAGSGVTVSGSPERVANNMDLPPIHRGWLTNPGFLTEEKVLQGIYVSNGGIVLNIDPDFVDGEIEWNGERLRLERVPLGSVSALGVPFCGSRIPEPIADREVLFARWPSEFSATSRLLDPATVPGDAVNLNIVARIVGPESDGKRRRLSYRIGHRPVQAMVIDAKGDRSPIAAQRETNVPSGSHTARFLAGEVDLKPLSPPRTRRPIW